MFVIKVFLLLLTIVHIQSLATWTEDELERALWRIPKHHLKTIIPVMMNFSNETIDFSKMHVRNSIARFMGCIFVGFSLLGAAGLTAQIVIVTEAIETLRLTLLRGFKRNIAYLVINSFNDFFKMVVVYSFSFIQMTHVAWPYGQFWCHTLPMIQDFCFNFSTLVIFIVMYNRAIMFKNIGNDPNEEMLEQSYGVPIAYGLISIMVLSMFSVVFYSVFIEYISLENYLGNDFYGIGICVANLNDNIPYFIQMVFFAFYIIPFAVCAKFHCSARSVLKGWLKLDTTAITNSFGQSNSHRSLNEHNIIENIVISGQKAMTSNATVTRRMQRITLHRMIRSESLRQQMFKRIFVTQAVCLAPINLLRLIKHIHNETIEHAPLYDIIYLIVVGIQFVPLVLNAVYFHYEKKTKNCHKLRQ